MKVYLDSCIFVYVEKEISNPRIIIELAEQGSFSVVISSHTVYEIIHNLKRQHSKDMGYMFSLIYVFPKLETISENVCVSKPYSPTLHEESSPG